MLLGTLSCRPYADFVFPVRLLSILRLGSGFDFELLLFLFVCLPHLLSQLSENSVTHMLLW